MSTFSDLQAAHEELIHKAQSSEDILEQAQQYLKDIQSGSSRVSPARERDQLRANLRYWTGYVYEKTGEYPNVDLLPPPVPPWWARAFDYFFGTSFLKRFLVLALICLFIIILGTFRIPRGGLDPILIAYVEQTQTATLWTPAPGTPSATPVPKQAFILNALNDALQQEADPLEETLDAKFSIIDIGFDSNGNSPTTVMEVHVECVWITSSTCSEQRAFIAFANAFKGLKPGIRKKIKDEIPVTIKTVQVRAFNHMTQIGIIGIDWQFLLDFADGNITGDQLAARAFQFPHP
jgi:hypothetical protein